MKIKNAALMASLAMLITVAALWLTNRAATPRVASSNDLVAEAKSGGYGLITTNELLERYWKDSNSFLLVDTRQEWEYRAGHIKDAFNFPIEPTWWSRWKKSSDLEVFLGPDKGRMIVFY